MGDVKVFSIEVGDDFKKPSDEPVHGKKRLVRLLPTPVGSRPAIWTSPYIIDDPDIGKAKICLILESKGPPPNVIAVRIPVGALEKFPLVPIEW
jgi:hypothetical protein